MCKRLIVVALCSLAVVAFALEQASRAEDLALAEAEQWVRAKGWREGFDPATKRVVVVASAGFRVPNSPPAFTEARRGAYGAAMQDARRAAAELIAAEVAAATDSGTSLQEVIGDPALAKALTGIAADQASRLETNYRDAVEVVARATVAGMYASQTFEFQDGVGNARVAVVATTSPGSVEAMLGRATGPCDRRSLGDWVDSQEAPRLAHTFGVRFAYDEKCNLRPVAFGQAAVRPGSMGFDDAFNLAREDAVGELQAALRLAIASRTLSESVERGVEATGVPDTLVSVRRFEQSVPTEAVSRFGIEVVGRRRVSDPATGGELVVVAVSIAPTGTTAPPAVGASPAGEVAAAQGCPPVPERMAHAVRQIQAHGTGRNRSEALANALFEAIRRDGAQVEGSSILKRQFQAAMESVGDEVKEKSSSDVSQSSAVKTFANGFIHSYEVLGETQESGAWEVSVCANLVQFDPKDPRFGLPPTVAVMPIACTAGSVTLGASPAPCDSVTQACEQAFDAALAETGAFMVIAERDWDDLGAIRQDIAQRVREGTADEAEVLKLGKGLTADRVLLGSVSSAGWTGEPGQRPQRIAANDRAWATIGAKLVDVTTGELLWSKEATVTLKGRDLIDIRNGKDLKNASEQSLSPLQLAVSRAAGELSESIQQRFGSSGGRAGSGGQTGESAPSAPGRAKILRVALGVVTLDASNPTVVVGARFAVNLLVDITMGGRVVIDRDHVATIEVISVDGALAKARVVDGDADAIDPAKCEAVPEGRPN